MLAHSTKRRAIYRLYKVVSCLPQPMQIPPRDFAAADQHSRVAAREEERRRVLRRFELHSAQPQGRYPAIDEIAQLAKDVFQVDAVIVNAGESAPYLDFLLAPACMLTV